MTHSSLGKNVFAPLSVNTFNMNNTDILYEAKNTFPHGKGLKFKLKGLRHN